MAKKTKVEEETVEIIAETTKKKTSPKSKAPKRRTRLLALEQRMLFDGALAADISSQVQTADGSDHSTEPYMVETPVPGAAASVADRAPVTRAVPGGTVAEKPGVVEEKAVPVEDRAIPVDEKAVPTADKSVAEKVDVLGRTDAGAGDTADRSALGMEHAVSTAPTEILFVDGGLQGVQQLLAGVRADVQVFVLDPNRDGFAQISDALAGRQDIAAVHIVTHGDPGRVALGNLSLIHI